MAHGAGPTSNGNRVSAGRWWRVHSTNTPYVPPRMCVGAGITEWHTGRGRRQTGTGSVPGAGGMSAQPTRPTSRRGCVGASVDRRVVPRGRGSPGGWAGGGRGSGGGTARANAPGPCGAGASPVRCGGGQGLGRWAAGRVRPPGSRGPPVLGGGVRWGFGGGPAAPPPPPPTAVRHTAEFRMGGVNH